MINNFLFQLVSTTAKSIKANHISPDGLQAENITITFNPNVMTGSCRVSVSISDLLSVTMFWSTVISFHAT